MPPRIGAIPPRRTPVVSPDGAQGRSGAAREGCAVRVRGRPDKFQKIYLIFYFFLVIMIFISYIGARQRPNCARHTLQDGAARASFPADPDRRSHRRSRIASSAKGGARPRRYSSPSSEGEARWGCSGGRRASPQGDSAGGPEHPHPLRCAPGLPPLKRGKDIHCGVKAFCRGIPWDFSAKSRAHQHRCVAARKLL